MRAMHSKSTNGSNKLLIGSLCLNSSFLPDLQCCAAGSFNVAAALAVGVLLNLDVGASDAGVAHLGIGLPEDSLK